MNLKISSKLVKTDVTALKFFQNDYLLVGIGQCLYIYRISDNHLLVHKDNVFKGQRIHGFVTDNEKENEHNVAIYGGKQIRLYNIFIEKKTAEDGESCLVDYKIDKHITLNDWIINLIWFNNNTQLAVLTAHNVVKIYDIESESIQAIQYDCEEKCILYCGSLLEIEKEIVVFGGTAFSQVIIWTSASSCVYHRLTGHKGVIFSVSYNKDKNIIISTSDDRSVRIWSICNDEQNKSSLRYWEESNISLRHTLFGHLARVMQHIYVEDYIISIGEDTLLCIWDLNGKLVSKRKICPNGVLWSVDYDSKKKIIAVGGGDAGITILPFVKNESTALSRSLEFFDPSLESKTVVLTFRGNAVCLTKQGDVLYYDFDDNIWKTIYKISPNVKSFLSLSMCKQFVAVGSENGHLDIFVESCKNEATLSHYISQDLEIDGKMFSLHWVYDRNIVVCDSNGIVTVWVPQGVNSRISVMSFQIPKSKQRWLTAAALDPSTKQLLIVGDRCGNLHVFKRGTQNVLQSLNKLHGNIGINIVEINGEKVLTAGRNGLVKLMKINRHNEKVQLNLLYNVKVPFDWIERFLDKNRHIVCGFKETNLIVWNINDNSKIVDINCGGGHRSWDLAKKYLKTNEECSESILRLVYIKNSKVHLVDTKYNDLELKRISYCFHSKEINCNKVIPACNSQEKMYYFVSGGEDTVVNVSCYLSDKAEMENILNISNHLSNIRCMCLTNNKNDEWFLYTGGGRAQLCVTKIETTNKSKDVNCYDLASYMLNGTDLERKKKGGISKWQIDCQNDVETRFMSLDLITKYSISTEEFVHFVLAGCSDGLLRIYKIFYNDYKCEITLDKTINYHKKCILNVKCFEIDNKIIGITMAVNGIVAFWNFTSYTKNSDYETNLKPFFYKKIHKAGINAFDLKVMDNNKLILATGGDDNAFCLNVFHFEWINNLHSNTQCLFECKFDKYHCSQITGIAFCANNIIIITSIDQRVTLVRWLLEDNIECQFLSQYCSSIPDIQGLNILEDNEDGIQLCVFGKGVEMIEIQTVSLQSKRS